MSRAEKIFNSIRTGRIDEIERLIAEQVTEELFLDYKTVDTPPTDRRLSDPDRRNLAKAISGFGNSDGGVVIWGVDCRRDTTTGRELVSKKAISDPTAFKSVIDGVVGGLTLPAHEGVTSEALSFASGGGVVVTYVPEGLNVPYRSIASGANGYFMRAGSSFMEVPHGVLAGMFGRRPAPKITGKFRPKEPQAQPRSPGVKVSFELVLMNHGRGIANDLFVIVKGKDVPGVLLRRKGLNDALWVGDQFDGQWVLNTNNAFIRLVPGAQIVPCEFQLEIQRTPRPVLVQATCASSNSVGSEFKLSLGADDLSYVHENLSHDFGADGGSLREALKAVGSRLRNAL